MTEGVAGRQLLVEIFGDWPSFHDAEVVAVRMHRERPPSIEADIHTSGGSPGDRDTLVTLAFSGIAELELGGFNGQNVLFDLRLRDVSELGMDAKWDVELQASYGLWATFVCEDVAVLKADPFERS